MDASVSKPKNHLLYAVLALSIVAVLAAVGITIYLVMAKKNAAGAEG